MSPGLEHASTLAAQACDLPGASWIGRLVQERYLVEEPLGEGGVGAVYRARHVQLDRPVALKVLRRHHNERWVSRKRFEREARALAKLNHAHVVSVIDFGLDEGAPFLVMEFLEGESLAARLGRGPVPAAVAGQFCLELLEGLAYAHDRGLVHRDVKPGNAFVERGPRGREHLKLLDFGLAKFVESHEEAAVTVAGEVWGTPAYMAPEQITGEACGPATDVYAAGLLIFEILTGRRPFEGNEARLMQQQLAESLPPLSSDLDLGGLAPGYDALIQRATAKEVGERYRDAGEMASALGELLDGRRLRAARSARERRLASGGFSALLGRVARGVAVLVSVCALLGIGFFALLIHLLEGPEGPTYRAFVQRTLPGFLDRSEPSP